MLKTLSGNVQRQGPVDTSQFETFWLNEHSKRATITVVQNGVRQPLPSDLVKRHEHIGDETCIIWFDDNGLCHREGNEPAVERFAEDPTDEPVLIQEWWVHGKRHRLYGPAVEYVNGGKEWWVNGERHRLDGPAIEGVDGTKFWWVNDKLHRLDGPAVEYANGQKEWWVNGEKHRLDGPAVEYVNGGKEWWVDGEKHRLHGPAVEFLGGYKEWWVNGKLHRDDGPAIEKVDGSKEWWVNGEKHRLDGPAAVLASLERYWWVNGRKTQHPGLCKKIILGNLSEEELYELCTHKDYVVRHIAGNHLKCPPEGQVLVVLADD